jgi:hypothetical protein
MMTPIEMRKRQKLLDHHRQVFPVFSKEDMAELLQLTTELDLIDAQNTEAEQNYVADTDEDNDEEQADAPAAMTIFTKLLGGTRSAESQEHEHPLARERKIRKIEGGKERGIAKAKDWSKEPKKTTAKMRLDDDRGARAD